MIPGSSSNPQLVLQSLGIVVPLLVQFGFPYHRLSMEEAVSIGHWCLDLAERFPDGRVLISREDMEREESGIPMMDVKESRFDQARMHKLEGWWNQVARATSPSPEKLQGHWMAVVSSMHIELSPPEPLPSILDRVESYLNSSLSQVRPLQVELNERAEEGENSGSNHGLY